ncbi:primosomal protein DnaI, partial [Streptococcus pyogenes]
MEKIGETMAKLGQNTRVNSDQLIQTILADPEVAS